MDDGIFIGSRSSLLALLSCFTHSGTSFGLHINLSKCDLYRPSEDCSFPEFPEAIKRINPESSGLELLGCPIWGPPTFFETFFSNKLERLRSFRKSLQNLATLRLNCICSGAVSVCVRSYTYYVVFHLRLQVAFHLCLTLTYATARAELCVVAFLIMLDLRPLYHSVWGVWACVSLIALHIQPF